MFNIILKTFAINNNYNNEINNKNNKDNDVFIIKYNNINKVYQQDMYLIVECSEQYKVDKEQYVKAFNYSTTPYKHTYRDARIVGAYE